MLLPAGTVTFLFTDIEGSTSLWEQFPDAMQAALARHDTILRTAIEANNGVIVKTTGDGCLAAFHTAPEALLAALSIQLALTAEKWPAQTPLKVRAALHTGTAELRDGDYFGTTLNRTARLLAVGYGGQTLLSQTAYDLVRDVLPPNVTLLPLGEHRLKDLQRPEIVYQIVHPDLTADFPPLRSLNNPALPNNLPQQTTSFIGTEAAILEVKSLLEKTRLLTLLGSGGCGKTRLALQVAAEMLDGSGDGVWFIELAPLADPALVPQTVANVLCVKEEPGKPISQTLTEHLKSKRMLILLDNCEHLIEACAKLADALLKNCPKVTLLATSREVLNIAGELTYRVPSLSLPDTKQTQTVESMSQFEAVQLFIERAVFHQTAFTVTNDNAPALAQLCAQLDGIPLAIELAAARVRSLSVEEINGKLDNRFRLLTGGSRNVLPRQQTLRALIDWSYDLLNEQERTLLCRLSVFAGGWVLEAAEAVGVSEPGEGAAEEGEVLDLLTSLVDKSLVIAEPGTATRCYLLETMRQYAVEKLRESGEAEAAHNRHLIFYLAFAEQAGRQLQGPEQTEWLRRLETEHDNLRAALAWSLEAASGVEAGLKMTSSLWRFWQMRGHLSEAAEWQAGTLARADETVPPLLLAQAMHGAAAIVYWKGDYAQAKALHERSLTLRREAGDRQGMASSLANLGLVSLSVGDHATAKAYYEAALNIIRETGNRAGEAIILGNLGNVSYYRGEYATAQVQHEQALLINRENGNRGAQASNLCNIGNVFSIQGQYEAAKASFAEGLQISRELGYKFQVAVSLGNLATMAMRQTKPERAGRLLGAADALRAEIGVSLEPNDREEYDTIITAAKQIIGAAAFDTAWAEGRAFTLEQAVALALE